MAYDLVGPYDCSPPRRGDSTGATENAGFNAKVQRNHGLDFVKKAAQIVAKKINQFTAADFPTFAMSHLCCGGRIRAPTQHFPVSLG